MVPGMVCEVLDGLGIDAEVTATGVRVVGIRPDVLSAAKRGPGKPD